jgi:MFS family permease
MATWLLRFVYAVSIDCSIVLTWPYIIVGVGAFASPLVGQTLLARGWEWPRFFIISVCLGCVNTIFIAYTFHTTKQEFQQEKAKATELLRQEHEAFELGNRTTDVSEEATPPWISRQHSSPRNGKKSGTCI